MKTCFKCGESKPRAEFYAHSQMGDGLLGKCKVCTKKDTATRAAEKSKDPAWALQERRRHRIKAAIYTVKKGANVSPARHAHSIRKYRTNNPEKYAAHAAVAKAIRQGTLSVKPCEKCGEKAHAHHDDYSKPLDVRWFCPGHHGAHHAHLREQALIKKLTH
jgi:hypothetical protein